jgi:hypothetical protein
MIFITGPLYSGKRTFAQKLPGTRLCDVQTLAAPPTCPHWPTALPKATRSSSPPKWAAVSCRWMLPSAPPGKRPAALPACWPRGQTALCRCSAAFLLF